MKATEASLFTRDGKHYNKRGLAVLARALIQWGVSTKRRPKIEDRRPESLLILELLKLQGKKTYRNALFDSKTKKNLRFVEIPSSNYKTKTLAKFLFCSTPKQKNR